MFAHAVAQTWETSSPDALALPHRDGLAVVVDPSPRPRGVFSAITRADGGQRITATEPALRLLLPELLVDSMPEHGALTPQAVSEAVAAAGLELDGEDHLFFPTTARSSKLQDAPLAEGVRALGPDDAATFEAFVASQSEDDVDEAYVELEHWLVMGAFVDGRLAAVASAYPWGEQGLADIGVLTGSEHRGQGLGASVVRGLCRVILERGLHPQYRCAPENVGSAGVARRVGLSEYGFWQVLIGLSH